MSIRAACIECGDVMEFPIDHMCVPPRPGDEVYLSVEATDTGCVTTDIVAALIRMVDHPHFDDVDQKDKQMAVRWFLESYSSKPHCEACAGTGEALT